MICALNLHLMTLGGVVDQESDEGHRSFSWVGQIVPVWCFYAFSLALSL